MLSESQWQQRWVSGSAAPSSPFLPFFLLFLAPLPPLAVGVVACSAGTAPPALWLRWSSAMMWRLGRASAWTLARGSRTRVGSVETIA